MGRCFAIGMLCLGLFLTATLLAAAQPETVNLKPETRPLEEVPTLAAPVEGLPAPATWPVRRYERRLRMLAVIGLQHAAAPFQRIARRCHASLDLIVAVDTGGGTPDDITTLAHTNDQWIEAKEKPSVKEVADHADRVRQEVLASAAGRYDVIFCSQPRPELAAYAEAGGIWVVCGNVNPDAKSPLASLWPGKPTTKNTWHSGGAQRGEAPEVAGLPLARLASHQWHGLYEAAEGAQALATGEAGATFVRRIGKGAIVLVPTGPISRKWDAIEAFQRAYDHDEIWLRFWDQLLHGLAAEDKALPAMADLRPGNKEALPGKEYALPGRFLNRTKVQQKLTASVHVVSPLGKVVHAGEMQDVTLEPGESREWAVKIPVAADWPTGLYATYLTVGDPAAKKQIHQAMEFVPVTGSVKLDLAADKPGYKLGEKATFTLKASAGGGGAAWQGEVCWAIHDFRGRVLACGALPAELGAEAKEIPFSWTFADHGVRVDTVWATAAAVKDGKEWARAERKVYKHERWDMRNEYQWSVWSGITCQAPCLVPQAMRLLAHAGFNALGYPGRSELHYPAERWSWRMYNEGVGTNTFSPVIESVTDEEIGAAQGKNVQKGADLQSGALVLASVGEEAGFKNGWGHTYYWNEPVAPDKACQAFQRFLKERYPSVETLNAAWGTRYNAWEDIKLTKEFSGHAPKIETDGWAHPKESPLGAGAAGVTIAPFTDTQQFYHWYYDKVIGAALKILREQVNPVPLTMSSAPSSWIFVSPRCETRLAGGSGWMECQQWSLSANGQAPGFALIWGHFDWPVATENMLWGFVLTRSGHNDYWVDVPLHFNPDMTPTRSAFSLRRWRARTAHAERLLLDAVPVVSEAGVLGPSGAFLPQTPGNMANSVKIALNQAGFGFADADLKNKKANKIVFAVFLNSVSRDQAAALATFVENGGTLVFGQRFAGQDQHGVPQKDIPGFGLAEAWGLTVTGKNDGIPQYYRADVVSAPLDALGPEFQGLRLDSHKVFVEQVKHNGWTELAAYKDKTPALLTRTLGKGRLVYMNVAYQSQWYIQWVSPTDKARQGFYRVIEKLCADAGVKRTFRIDGNLAETLHMAAVQWTDPSGQIGYAVTRTNGETVWTSGKLTWLGSQTACYDVYGGEAARPAPAYGKEVALQLRPGAGRLLAFTQAPVRTVKATVTPAAITAGQPLQLKAEILDDAGKAVPGRFPMDIRVIGPAGEIAGLRRDLSLASGESMTIQTAHNDPAGRWQVALREDISRLQGEAAVEVKASADADKAPGFRPWGWPSEQWEPERMPEPAFIARLRQLADVYRKDHSNESWLAKQWLGAHYCFFPGTRHDLFRDLADVDWTQYAEAIRKAVEDGENLVLVGEDLGLDPATGLRAWPSRDGRQIEAVATAMAQAVWEALSGDGEVVRARLGKGSLVLSRTTPDGASSSWGCAAAWHKGLLATLAVAKPAGPIRTPDAARLARWLAGRETLLEGARVVTWQGGWEALEGRTPVWKGEWTQALDPARAMPGPVFVLRLPPTGSIKEAAVDLAVAGEAPVQVDVGADGSVEAECKPAFAATVPWAEAIGKHLAWRESACGGVERDLNGWRLVPIRFSSPGKVQVAVKKASVTVE